VRVLVIGNGGREHALAWKLRQSPRLTELLVAPGNGGTAAIAENIPVLANDIPALLKVAQDRHVDLVVVGPEEPLSLGVADAFHAGGIRVFGPTQAAAQIEASKVFAKDLMQRYGIPCARSSSFADIDSARAYLGQQPLPIVIKADGLAAGKGVVVARTRQDAEEALEASMVRGAFGKAGSRVVIEDFLEGVETSAFAFCDGDDLLMTVPACDYKTIFDNDQGPNTGGMGGYSPPEFVSANMFEEIRDAIMAPTLLAMKQEGRPFTGVLYGGIMVTRDGPKVFEFNCRLGDPEAQLILLRLKTDLLDVIDACLDGDLKTLTLDWTQEASVGVVLASPGYPGDYPRGLPITGLDSVEKDIAVFHAGTRLDGDHLVTNGGRVMTVTALAPTLREARDKAYRNVQRIHFEGVQYRTDIALRAVGPK